MRDHSTVHGTVVVEKMLDVPVARVYAAFADPKARANWGAPSDTAAFFYEEADFRVGGRDVARCGAKEEPRFRVEARYVDIVKERRVVGRKPFTKSINALQRTSPPLNSSLTARAQASKPPFK